MSYTGTVENGVVKLPPEARLPDGTPVRVEPLAFSSAKLIRKHGYLVAVGPRRVTWQETRKAMDEFP
jgi:hypothetical protein